MRAVVYQRPEEFDIVDVPDRPLAPGEARVRCEVVGLCGTDLHLHEGGFNAAYPLTPGHEIIGMIIELAAGDGIDPGVRVGDRVAVDNSFQCGRCAQCREARGWLCANYQALGVTQPGGFAEHVITPAEKCFPIGGLPADAAVLIEPASCAVHGIDVLDARPGVDVLVLGAGPTGQLLAQLIVRGGSARVTVAAPTAFKLDVARAHGVDETVLLARDDLASAEPALLALAGCWAADTGRASRPVPGWSRT
jgi:D-arabinitol dehydrogenase (NADP+)